MPTEPLGESAATTEPTEPAGESPATATPTEASEVLDTDSQEMEEPEIRAEPEAAPAEAQRAICVRAGWFRDPAAAAEAAEWMRSAGAEAVEVRQEEQQIIKNYQVYLPPAPSREAAKAMASETARQGRGRHLDHGRRRAGQRDLARRVPKQGLHDSPRRRIGEAGIRGRDHGEHEDRHRVCRRIAHAAGDGSALEDAWNAEFQDHAIRRVDCADRT